MESLANISSSVESRECIVLEQQGQKIFGVFHRPLHTENFPAILICHGLGGNKVGRYRLYVTLSTRLAELGIGSLRIDFRGSGDSEGDFSQMTIESEVSDALLGLDFLRRQKGVNKERVGIFGRSLGGLVAVLTASRDKANKSMGSIKSMGLWAPIFSSSQWVEKWNQVHAGPIDPLSRQELMTVEGQVPGYEFYKQFFMLKTEDSVASLNGLPLLLIHGSMDSIVTLDHTEQYVQVRMNGKGETKFIELPHSDHDFTHLEERRVALDETCRWFQKTL